MFRSQVFRILSSEQCLSPLLWKKSHTSIYTNSCHCLKATNILLKAKEATLTSNSIHDRDTEIPEKWRTLKEKDFLARLKEKGDPDTFGTQTEDYFDEGDIVEEKYISERPLPSQKLRDKEYGDIIKGLIRKRKIKEAIDVVEVRMIKEDRVKPSAYIYNLLLGGCGRVGYTKKAFMLYNDMKRRGLPVMGGTYTALFNACANSPWPETDGLTRAHHLHKIMIEKGHQPNDTTYNAMIKAFGRCGDLSKAFFLVDEMISKKIALKNDTITFLLQACVSDNEAGFRHALLVWRKLINKKVKPSLYNYNTLLRCVRDCGLGDIETIKDVINEILSSNTTQKLLLNSENNLVLSKINTEHLVQSNASNEVENVPLSEVSSSTNDKAANQWELENFSLHSEKELMQNYSISDNIKTPPNEIITNSTVNQQTNSEFPSHNFKPNLIATVPYLGSLISLSEVKQPQDRLLLVGGFKGFLEDMSEHNCKPDIKTFTQLLDCIPGSLAAEQELLSLLTKYELKPDIDFYNMLMRKRSLRGDYDGAKVVLEMVRMNGYKSNIMTYGILAMACKTKDECNELLQEMKAKKYAINIETLGAMLHQACMNNDVSYVLHLMDLCLTENVNPSKKFIDKLDWFKKKCKGLYLENKISEKQWKLFKKFKKENQTWRDKVHMEEDHHPWQQYRQPNESEAKSFKDTTRFKARHKSLFKVKTSTKIRY